MKVILLQELKGKGGEGTSWTWPPALPTTTCSRRRLPSSLRRAT